MKKQLKTMRNNEKSHLTNAGEARKLQLEKLQQFVIAYFCNFA